MDSATVPRAPVRPKPAGDDRGGLDGRGRHQPDLLAGVEVRLGEGAGAGPDAVGHVLVVDLLADGHQLGDAVALDDGQRAVAGVLHVLGVLDPGQPEPGLLPGEPGEFTALEELPFVEAAAEVEERGALHHGVVEIEEGGGADVPDDGEGRRLVGRSRRRVRRVQRIQ